MMARREPSVSGAHLQDSVSAGSSGTPAPITIGSIDAAASTVVYLGTTISNVTLSNSNGDTEYGPNSLTVPQQSSGSTIPVTVTFNYAFDPTPGNDACTGGGCIIQAQIGLSTDSAPQACGPNGNPGNSGSGATATVQVPNQPGRYYVAMDRSLDYGCFVSGQQWWDGPPSASRWIGIIDVQ